MSLTPNFPKLPPSSLQTLLDRTTSLLNLYDAYYESTTNPVLSKLVNLSELKVRIIQERALLSESREELMRGAVGTAKNPDPDEDGERPRKKQRISSADQGCSTPSFTLSPPPSGSGGSQKGKGKDTLPSSTPFSTSQTRSTIPPNSSSRPRSLKKPSPPSPPPLSLADNPTEIEQKEHPIRIPTSIEAEAEVIILSTPTPSLTPSLNLSDSESELHPSTRQQGQEKMKEKEKEPAYIWMDESDSDDESSTPDEPSAEEESGSEFIPSDSDDPSEEIEDQDDPDKVRGLRQPPERRDERQSIAWSDIDVSLAPGEIDSLVQELEEEEDIHELGRYLSTEAGYLPFPKGWVDWVRFAEHHIKRSCEGWREWYADPGRKEKVDQLSRAYRTERKERKRERETL